MMDIRMVAYKMDISPDAAEKLANEVGEELVRQLLEKVRLKSEHQKKLPFHPKKKSNATIFAQEAVICRRKFQGEKRERRKRQAYDESLEKSRQAHENGYCPDADTIYEHLEDGIDTIELNGKKITYKEFKMATRFLESLEDDA